MANALTKIPSKIFDSFKKMSKGQKVRLFVLITIIIIILVLVSVFLNQKSYTVLYRGMSAAESGEVLGELESMGVDAKAQGTDVLVEDSVIDSVRMQLAAKGYPSSGLSYDIFQNASGLGVTDMEKQVYYQFQLQENLRKTIMKMTKVEDAVVNIDLGEDSSYVFSDKEEAATASVLLELRGGQRLAVEEVKTIAELVSGAVSGLAMEDVRIMDSQMNLYNAVGDTSVESIDTQMGLQASVQKRLQTQVVNLLSPVFGEQNVLAEINVVLNFDTKITESVEFEPPVGGTEGLVVSMKELVEAITSDTSGDIAGIDANGSASQYLAALGQDNSAVYYNVSREANYEINETKTQIEQAKGKLEELSVSVIINSDAADDYSEEVVALIATAIGVDAQRITVAMLPFLPAPESDELQNAMQAQQEMLAGAQDAETMRLVILVVAALVVLIFLTSIIRMFRRGAPAMAAEGGFEYMADEVIMPGEEARARPSFDDISLEDLDKTDNKLVILEDYIAKNPESVANLLRNWLNEE